MSGGNEDNNNNNLPRDAKVVMSLLKSMGVEEYEPRVVHQLLEFWYRYVVDVLSDAQIYSDHASKPVVDSEDVKLAIQTRVNSSFSQPPPREVLMELARSRNKVPLPKATPGAGVPLPPEEDTLVFPNYQLMVPKRVEMVEEEDVEDVGGTGSVNVGSTQEQLGQPQQRVSFPLTAAKRPR